MAVIVAQPYGNFPLNDDAHYAIAAFDFAKTGRFHLTIETVPSLRAQVVWGALFVRIFGESFEVLRASTMTLAVLTLLIVNRLLALLPVSRSLRIVATLALLLHPMFFLSSFTYMTEVPFVFASAAAMYCHARAIRDESAGWLLAGGAFVAISWWIRQTGIINALPPLIVLFLLRERLGDRVKRLIAAAAIPVAVFGIILVTRPDWLSGSQREFQLHYKMWGEETFRLPQQVALIFHYIFFNAQLSALFFLPLALVVDWRAFRAPAARVILIFFAVVFLGGATQLVALSHPMPYVSDRNCCDIAPGNLLIDFGLGPTTLRDGYLYPFATPYPLRLVLTYGTALLAAALVAAIFVRLIDFVRAPKQHATFLLAASHAIISTVALCASVQYCDRYGLDAAWSVVLLAPLLARWDRADLRALAGAGLVAIAIFSTFATGEYFSWNRARWDAIAYFRAQGGDVTTLDAGNEAFVLYELSHITDYRIRRRYFSGVPVRPNTVAMRQLKGYRIVRAFPFEGWLGLHRANVYLLESTATRER